MRTRVAAAVVVLGGISKQNTLLLSTSPPPDTISLSAPITPALFRPCCYSNACARTHVSETKGGELLCLQPAACSLEPFEHTCEDNTHTYPDASNEDFANVRVNTHTDVTDTTMSQSPPSLDVGQIIGLPSISHV